MVKGSLIIGLFIEDLQGKFKQANLTRQRFVDIHFTINDQSKPNSLKKVNIQKLMTKALTTQLMYITEQKLKS